MTTEHAALIKPPVSALRRIAFYPTWKPSVLDMTEAEWWQRVCTELQKIAGDALTAEYARLFLKQTTEAHEHGD